jgi:hypothetical protein
MAEGRSDNRRRKEKNDVKDTKSPQSARVTILKPFSSQSNRANSSSNEPSTSSRSNVNSPAKPVPQMQILSSHVGFDLNTLNNNLIYFISFGTF